MNVKSINLIASGIAILLASGQSVCAQEAIPENLKGKGEVVVTSGGGTWEDAQKKAFYEPFTRDTGIKVVLVPEDHSKLLASIQVGQPEADVTSIPGGFLAGFVNKGAVQEINYGLFDKDTLAAIPDNLKNKYGIGALLYSVGIAYDETRFKDPSKAPKNWGDFYNVSAFPGMRTLPKCEKMIDGGMLEGALMGDGVQPKDVYPIDIDRAFAKVAAIKPNVSRWWTAGAEAPQSLIDGEVDIADAYNGRIFAAKKQGAPLAFSWDQSLLQYDYWVVTKGAPNRDNADKLLAYIAMAKPQAAFAELIGYGPVNKKAYDLIPEDLRKTLPGAPGVAEKQVFQNYAWWNETGADGKTNWENALKKCVSLLSQ
ncbi:ABC transporter substrate-binding protein (plasmid) [Rhizobium sp. CB3090]|uniref:ABC transporter substrate-binding protein n=1 Tax=Rhizobium sp. CB3090 TaxID=3039156 RepID=UPI0024B2488A|nr:ABC transporter substrate-binding protein [Rhizobium sp. CB3090]WFU11903.1 ABC transporter substrate-binding protein [Rhizobium sp. CB3090]